MSIFLSIKKIFYNWLNSIDVINLFLIILLGFFGLLFVTTASPSIAKLKSLEEFYFVKKHALFLIGSFTMLLFFSLCSKKMILLASLISGFICFLLMLFSLLQNVVNNGASRWIHVMGFSIQPSEFFKPFFIVILAYLIARKTKISIYSYSLDGKIAAFITLILTSIILIKQPNYSMVAILFFVVLCQFFISGINIKFITLTILTGLIFSTFSFFSYTHIKERIVNYVFSDKPNYQVEKSIEAFKNGGLLGVGPGEGRIKKIIPDAHTDFIFPVIAEEYGIFSCILIISIIFIIFFRGLYRTSRIDNLFPLLASSGLLILFLIQSLVNISVSLKIIPTTGVTLPLISYGGSSLVSTGIIMGIVLALTRKKFGIN